MKTGQKIAWRWKDNEYEPFIEAWVVEQYANMVKLADYRYGKGQWCRLDEIEWHELPE